MAVLLIKLGLSIMGALTSGKQSLDTIPEVIAGEEKPGDAAAPKNASYAYAQTEKNPKSNAASSSVSDSLSALQQRELELQKREDLLRDKEERLGKIEKEVEQKVKDLLALQKEIQAAKAEKLDSQGTKVKSLAKIYGTMKPKEAAKLMENLDEKLVMNIIATMTPDEAASILSLMDVKKAAKISEALSGR
jgi:flagellar motility protein MotE (MotC chaperone)